VAAGTGIPAGSPTARQARKGGACLRADTHRQAALIKQVYASDPIRCPKCGAEMKTTAFIERHQTDVIEKILRHCGLWEEQAARAPPSTAVAVAPAPDSSRSPRGQKKCRLTAMINAFLDETVALLRRLDHKAIERARQILLKCYREQGQVYAMGNGGSASTAQHFACDLAKYVIPTGARPFTARCLTDNVSLYTAWANDADRADVFVNQMRGLLASRDVVLTISVHGGKGFSTDLVRAVRYAREVGATTIALVGFDGGLLHQEATCSILVPVESTPQTEAVHLVIEHLLMHLLRADLAGQITHA